MTLKTIMKEISSGITGNYTIDRAYLLKNKEAYKDHELAYPISCKIDILLEEIKPKNIQKQIVDDTTKEERDIKKINHLYRGALEYISEGDYDRAKKQIEFLLTKYDLYLNKEKHSDMYSFCDVIEVNLFKKYYKKDNIALSKVDYSEIFRTYSDILFEFNEFDKAIDSLNSSIKWDPVNVSAYIDMSKMQYIIKDYDAFLDNINKAIFFATTKEDLATCYEYLANYNLENEEYELAIALYMLSKNNIDYENLNHNDKLELLYKMSGNRFVKSKEQIRELLSRNNINIGPSSFVIDSLVSIIENASQNKNFEIENYATNVLKKIF